MLDHDHDIIARYWMIRGKCKDAWETHPLWEIQHVAAWTLASWPLPKSTDLLGLESDHYSSG